MSFLRSHSDATLNTFNDPKRWNADESPRGPSLVMRNAFLIFRLVVLALLTNLAFLSLIFAAWNARATVSDGQTASTTAIFIIFQSCVTFFCVALAILGLFYPSVALSRTIVECAWVGALTPLAMGTAISSSMNGFAVACNQSPGLNTCASASLLMPLTWLSSVLTSGYFMALFITTIAHRPLYQDVWRRSVYEIEWFGHPVHLPPTKDLEDVSPDSQDQESTQPVPKEANPYDDLYGDDINATAAPTKRFIRNSTVPEVTAPWAVHPTRRGVDNPFARQPAKVEFSSSKTTTPVLPALSATAPLSVPHRTATTATKSGSRFVERFRESLVLTRQETPSQYLERLHSTRKKEDSFPRAVVDVDKPIPLPNLNEWVKADGQKHLGANSGRPGKF